MGNFITDYTGKISTETAGLELIKLHWNSVLSTKNAKYMTMDISNMYLNTPLDRFEYMRMPIADIPQEIIDEYNLQDLVSNGWIYMEIRKALYGLKQSGALAAKKLAADLAPFGYQKVPFTTGLWKHVSRPITFTLVVDDFGVKYVNKEDAEHLESALKSNYPITTDWSGNKYIGINLDWNYKKKEMRTSMPGYVKKALKQFNHSMQSSRRQDSPSLYIAPRFGSRQPQMTPIDDTKPMTEKEKLHLQRVVGKFLYYARAIDDTMGEGLNSLSTQTSEGTQKTLQAQQHFLDYCSSNPDAVKLYKASEMILFVDSDASYLSSPGSKSRAGGFFYLGNIDGSIINGSILFLTTIIKQVMASAAEAEIAALFLNARLALPIRTALIELGHPQPPTKLKTDNNTASGFANGTIKQNKTKAIDMRFDWLKCRSAQDQFDIYWAPGKVNLADYFTKHHPPAHHKALRPVYLAPSNENDMYSMQRCIEILGARLGKKLSPALKHTTQATLGLKRGIKPATQIPVHKPRPTQPAWIIPNKVTDKTHSTKSTSPSTTHKQNTVTNSLIPTVFKWIQTPICRYSKQLQSAI